MHVDAGAIGHLLQEATLREDLGPVKQLRQGLGATLPCPSSSESSESSESLLNESSSLSAPSSHRPKKTLLAP